MSKSGDPVIPSVADGDGEDEADKTKVGASAAKGIAGLGKRDYPYLIVVAGAGVGEMYRLEHNEAIVGRSEKAQFRIVDDGISRLHARLIRAGDTLYVEDLESANGTMVNGEKITKCALKDGDKISVGSATILKFTYHDKIDEVFQQKMYEAALRDGLTKVYNKRYMLERLTTEFAYSRRHRTDLTLLMMDIDHFKQVNDVHGHPAGDSVLIKVASILQAVIRTEDILARFGGEEFAIICRNTDIANSAIVGERVRLHVESASFEWHSKKIPVTVSVGIASVIESSADTVEKLIAAADEALYAAKRGGRNRICKASPPG